MTSSLQVLNEICHECKDTCQSTLFHSSNGKEYLTMAHADFFSFSSVYGDDYCTMHDQDIITAFESNEAFFYKIGLAHLIGAAIVNKHVKCLSVLSEYNAMNNSQLFDPEFKLAYLTKITTTGVTPIKNTLGRCRTKHELLEMEQWHEGNYSHVHDLLCAYYDRDVFAYMWTCEIESCARAYVYGHFNVLQETWAPHTLKDLIDRGENDKAMVLVDVLSKYSVTMVDICHQYEKDIHEGMKEPSPNLVEFCKAYTDLQA